MQLTLSTRGRAVLAAGLTAIVCALTLRQLDLLRVGILLTGLPLLSLLSLRSWRGNITQLSVARPTTLRVPIGETCNIPLELKNPSPRAVNLLLGQDQLPHQFGRRPRFLLPGLAPGLERRVVYAVQPPARGRFLLGPLSLATSDPFGLAHGRYQASSTTELIVHPKTYALDGGSGVGEGGSGGLAPAGPPEENSIRQYSQGDDLRRVHWRTSARRGTLMVRQPEPEKTRSITIILSASGDSAAPGSDDWLLELAASAVTHFMAAQFEVELITNFTAALHGAALVEYLDHLADPPTALRSRLRAAAYGASSGSIIALLADADLPRCRDLVQYCGPARSGRALIQPPRTATEAPGADGLAELRRGGWRVSAGDYRQSGSQLWRDAMNASGSGAYRAL